MTYPPIKRALDVAGALSLLVLLGPLIVLVALAVLLAQGRPVFFVQVRPGLHERPFRIVKFRTLTNYSGRGAAGEELRMTGLGKFLRLLSLDELPQLLNILLGQMSFVGPRPLLMDYLPLYSTSQKQRHQVRPGLTGLAQVEGRNNVPWKERLELDVFYCQHMSFRKDIEILAKSVGIVLAGKGVAPHGTDSAGRFQG